MFGSPLERAIAKGMKPDGDLSRELNELIDYPIRSRADAKAICKALGRLPAESAGIAGITSRLHALAGLFQDVDGRDAPAFDVLYQEGLPHLIRIFDAQSKQANKEEADDLLFVLKILALYGSREGAEKVVSAARQPLKPDAYMWHPILSIFGEEHPHSTYVFEALSDPLPPDFLAVALLDSANAAAIKGELQQHPFDSQAGWTHLREWLEGRDPAHFSYAHSATAALPFVSNPPRDELLALAMDHIDAGVQMEAAWAAAKLGREAALKILVRYCLEVNHSEFARRYLAELDREDLIPAEVTEPAFQAKAEFASWLAHPNELGRPPDELQIVDHRMLAWPPDREPKPFWLIRFRARDKTGLEEDQVDCGLVGSMTWCFFFYRMNERPPEDAYAIHCYWEMENEKLIEEVEVIDQTEYREMLGEWQGDPLENATITHVAKLSPKLNYPAGRVALAGATLGGAEGWAIFDGPRSMWYPKAEQPDETLDSVILMIHIGRQLLGFRDQPDRKKHLAVDRPKREPQQIVATYEKLLNEAAQANPKRQKELLGSSGLLSQHYDEYVDAFAASKATEKADTVIPVYERFLEITRGADPSIVDDALGSIALLDKQFEDYIDALISRGRSGEIPRLIDMLSPHWDHNMGYSLLGAAAYKAGQREVAEAHLSKLRSSAENYYRWRGMSILAGIWHETGKTVQARELLVDCMRRLVKEIETSKYNSDRKTQADNFQHHRTTYLRLFPMGEAELLKLGIPVDPLTLNQQR
jgi:hypothetical protein